jgi:hypothetical protein
MTPDEIRIKTKKRKILVALALKLPHAIAQQVLLAQ